MSRHETPPESYKLPSDPSAPAGRVGLALFAADAARGHHLLARGTPLERIPFAARAAAVATGAAIPSGMSSSRLFGERGDHAAFAAACLAHAREHAVASMKDELTGLRLENARMGERHDAAKRQLAAFERTHARDGMRASLVDAERKRLTETLGLRGIFALARLDPEAAKRATQKAREHAAACRSLGRVDLLGEHELAAEAAGDVPMPNGGTRKGR